MGALEPEEFWQYERAAWARGYSLVAGVDEAGRGPLAGPVVAAAVVLPRDFNPAGVNDSKALSAKARDKMYDVISSNALGVGVGIIGPEVIDKINILQATHAAMKAALDDLSAAFDFVLIDGLPVAGICCDCQAIVKGDSKSVSIAAASIIAKVTRDRIMIALHEEYPQYGFASHKGYGAKIHMEAIAKYGICPSHRKSFAPVARRIENCRLPGLE